MDNDWRAGIILLHKPLIQLGLHELSEPHGVRLPCADQRGELESRPECTGGNKARQRPILDDEAEPGRDMFRKPKNRTSCGQSAERFDLGISYQELPGLPDQISLTEALGYQRGCTALQALHHVDAALD